jgi:hypothetical protein
MFQRSYAPPAHPQEPHSLTLFLFVEPGTIGGGDDERQRIRSAIAVHVFQPLARFFAFLLEVEKTRIGVQVDEAEPSAVLPSAVISPTADVRDHRRAFARKKIRLTMPISLGRPDCQRRFAPTPDRFLPER